jgi:hypothetical protein
MKRIVAGLVVVGLLALLVTPTPALAWSRRGGHGGGGHFVGGLALGALSGVIVGGILASRPSVVYEPAPVYVQPAPVYVAPPPPVCSDYFVPDGYRGGVWVQGHWERACR